jgi:hypothetical protein
MSDQVHAKGALQAYRGNEIPDKCDAKVRDPVAEKQRPQPRPLTAPGTHKSNNGYDQNEQIKRHG